jgi:carbon monoxide dehydrogenase subunit G
MVPDMRLENAFTVPAPVEQAWSVLLDVERVAPCLPGAALDGRDGAAFAGTMTIKLGPVTSRYRGTVEIEQADEGARRAVLRARASDARAGTASATISTALEPAGQGTRVSVVTELQLSGPAAQFGRGVMQDVSGKLMREFADCLAEELGVDGAPAASGASAGPALGAVPAGATAIAYEDTRVGRLPLGPAGDAAIAAGAERGAAGAGGPEAGRAVRARRSAEVLDLGAASRGAVVKRLAPLVALAAAAALAIRIGRRR